MDRNRAKFIGKSYDHDFVYLTYKYRGHEYVVYENTAKGTPEPLYLQYRHEQELIDRDIEINKESEKHKSDPLNYKDTAQYGFDLFMDYIEGKLDP